MPHLAWCSQKSVCWKNSADEIGEEEIGMVNPVREAWISIVKSSEPTNYPERGENIATLDIDGGTDKRKKICRNRSAKYPEIKRMLSECIWEMYSYELNITDGFTR